MHTKPEINRKIDIRTNGHIKQYINQDINAISQRIAQLEKEWDTERVLEANFSAVVTLTALLGYRDKRWFLLTGAVALFMLQHAVQGWCPPLPLIRKLGIRTAEEINKEITALKSLQNYSNS